MLESAIIHFGYFGVKNRQTTGLPFPEMAGVHDYSSVQACHQQQVCFTHNGIILESVAEEAAPPRK